MRNVLDRELNSLNEKLVAMGQMVVSAIEGSILALVEGNQELAQKIIKEDETVNLAEKEIERLALGLILKQHPVASDLRLVSSILKMITDLERIGDQAADIAEISLVFKKDSKIEIVKIPLMAELAISMVEDSIKAFIDGDLALCDSVILRDDQVDDMFHSLKDDLIIMLKQEDDMGFEALDFLMIGKYLERIADHAENIAEWVIYSITGKTPNI